MMLRKKIVEWQNSRTNIRLRMLQEKRDYEIKVEPSETQGGGYRAAILCQMCSKTVRLGVDKRGWVKLYNWYRHTGECIDRKKSIPTTKINHYFSSCGTKALATHYRLSNQQLPVFIHLK